MTTMPLFPSMDSYKAFLAKHGFCPLEAGLIGDLADHECKHGNLPSTKPKRCECFTSGKKR